MGRTGDRIIYISEYNLGVSNISANWLSFLESGFTPEIEKRTKEYMHQRLELETSQLSAEEEQLIGTIEELGRKHRKVVGLFPNLSWDGAVKERDTIFDGLGDWLKQTIEWAANEDILLVVREHPQPRHMYNQLESSIAMLRESMPEVDSYDNVLMIDGLTPVRSYRLVERAIDCSVVYNGTLGVEIPYTGHPTIIAANSPYSRKGVGYEPQSKEEYFDLILNVSADSEEFAGRRHEIQQNALRAAAYRFIYNAYHCPLMPTMAAFDSGDRYWQSWDLSPGALDPNQNPSWKRTIDRFLEPIAPNSRR
jgi:hypothetical protein